MKHIVVGFISYFICVVQSFLSLNKFENEPSSSCLDCSLLSEILRYSLLIVFMPIAFLLLKKAKKEVRSLITSCILIIVCFFVNISIFRLRVTSWSTFTFLDEFYGVISLTYLALIVSFVLFISLIKIKKIDF